MRVEIVHWMDPYVLWFRHQLNWSDRIRTVENFGKSIVEVHTYLFRLFSKHWIMAVPCRTVFTNDETSQSPDPMKFSTQKSYTECSITHHTPHAIPKPGIWSTPAAQVQVHGVACLKPIWVLTPRDLTCRILQTAQRSLQFPRHARSERKSAWYSIHARMHATTWLHWLNALLFSTTFVKSACLCVHDIRLQCLGHIIFGRPPQLCASHCSSTNPNLALIREEAGNDRFRAVSVPATSI